MWTNPRATIQRLVDSRPTHFVLFLSAVAGFSQALDQASVRNMGDSFEWQTIVLISAISGAFAGVLGLYVGGALLRRTGSWIGGRASTENIRAAIAWSSVPTVWALLLWLPGLAIFGQEIFTTETPIINASTTRLYLFGGFGLFGAIIGLWAFVVFLMCLGQVQGFSTWKALGNLLISVGVLLIIVAIGVLGFMGFAQ